MKSINYPVTQQGETIMNKTTKENQQKQIQSQDTVKYPELNDFVKYPELNDFELEIICGGGNLIGRNRGK